MSAPLFAVIVFVATTVQVLGNPLIGTMRGAVWDHPLPLLLVVFIAVATCALQAACLLALSRYPVAAMLGALTCYLAFALAVGAPNWTPSMQLVVAIALFALASQARPAVALSWLTAAIIITVVVLAFWILSTGAPLGIVSGFAIDQGLGFAVPAGGATALGLLWATHARLTTDARLEAARLAREQEARLAEARDIERARIAQELHDVAAQHVAGLISLCDASLTLAPEQPDRALQLLEEVRAEGRFAAASLYGAIGDLRAVDGQTISVTPDLRNVDDLIAFWSRRGMTVRLQSVGGVADLPAVVSSIAYRGMQEALANAAKHSPGSIVQVDVVVRSDRLEVAVTNSAGSTTRRCQERLGLGWGLDGLRSKLQLVDGTLHAAALDQGGWRTRIDIPFPDLDG
ncbi:MULTISPECIES: sensor histidine kinase [Microbacterium]|nr:MULTISPECIES: histidine kinase [Microbacterium]MCK6068510.1 two-component sensor histidine kinase [Microbacterium sp. EYE_512]